MSFSCDLLIAGLITLGLWEHLPMVVTANVSTVWKRYE